MERVPIIDNPKLFDAVVADIQKGLADNVGWLDHVFGLAERLTRFIDGKKYNTANIFLGNEGYEQIEPCKELGNFCFFYLRDPQEVSRKDKDVVLSPFSAIFWYNMVDLSFEPLTRNREAVKAQILRVFNEVRPMNGRITVGRVYERPENVFSDFSYNHTDNQCLMSPYAGFRIDGYLQAEIPCQEVVPPHPYVSLERLRHYLYRVTFDRLPEDDGRVSVPRVGCSAYVQNGKLYRNLDFHYDETATFIVKTRAFEGVSFITGLNAGHIEDSLVAQLPYRMVDGVNKHGIKVSTHILFNDWGWTGAGRRDVHITRLPFLTLMKVRSMATIQADLSDVLNNATTSEDMAGYLLQILVTDGTTTYALLPPTRDGEGYVLQDITNVPKLTNFRWVNRDTVDRAETDLQTRPTGIERFNAMPCSLESLKFTEAYENPTRLSEFIGLRETTRESSENELLAIYQDARALYLERQRDGETWQTVHSVVYGNKMEALYIQENWEDNCLEDNI